MVASQLVRPHGGLPLPPLRRLAHRQQRRAPTTAGEAVSAWSRPAVIKGTPPIGEVEARCAGCRFRFIAGEQYVSRHLPPFGVRVYAHPLCTARLDGGLAFEPSREENPNP